MCRIMAFTNAKNLDVPKAANVIADILSEIERDGFGYAVSGASGTYGEKSVAKTFESRIGKVNHNPKGLVKIEQTTFGTLDEPIGAAIFHGRTSTNDKGLKNCHPMQRDNWHLIHNGVVTDHGAKYVKNTSNDSEDLLHRLTLGIEHVERDLTGYYAFAAIDPIGRLHLCRDKIASLSVAWCESIDSYLIGTTSHLIKDVAESLDLTIEVIDEIRDDVYFIFEGNNVVHEQSIKSRGYEYRESRLASLSLGRELDTMDLDIDRHYQNELNNLDGTYSIFDSRDEEITLTDYYKLDYASQRQCTIFRPDGSCLEEWAV